MQSYTVHVPPEFGWSREQLAERMVMVPDGFAVLAFVLPPVWFAMRGLWLALVGYLVVIGVLEGLLWAVSAPPLWQTLAGAAVHLIIAFEADSIWRWSLGRKGWLEAATVSGRNVDECERRFLDDWLAQPSLRFARA